MLGIEGFCVLTTELGHTEVGDGETGGLDLGNNVTGIGEGIRFDHGEGSEINY